MVSLNPNKANPSNNPATVPIDPHGRNIKFGTFTSLQSICVFTSNAALTNPIVPYYLLMINVLPIILLPPQGIRNSSISFCEDKSCSKLYLLSLLNSSFDIRFI